MKEHYFSRVPQASSKPREFTARLLDETFTFQTDTSLFSKKGIDFGTRCLIEAVNVETADMILDLGCGYGPIGIAMAKKYPGSCVCFVDINERALALAQINAKLNHVQNKLRFYLSDGFEAVDIPDFDLILLNPPIRAGKAVYYRWFQEASNRLRPNGSFWVVIRKQQGAATARKELEKWFDYTELVTRIKGYWVLKAKND